jgi:site-specific DNA-methyltransferase (adenine-specific)
MVSYRVMKGWCDMNRIYFGDNLPILGEMRASSANLIYVDPPFNTGKVQSRTQIRTLCSEAGDRISFQGHKYIGGA